MIEEGENFIDDTQITFKKKILYAFKILKLSITIIGVSYFTGMFWYIVCDLMKNQEDTWIQEPHEDNFIDFVNDNPSFVIQSNG